MKILVTGGCGFIGSHLVNKLIEMNHEVIVLDNMSKGNKEYLSPEAKLIIGDVRDIDDVKKAIKGCSAVFHLAAVTDIRSDSDSDYQVNFLGSKNVFSLAEKTKTKVIFTSSAAVYGNSNPIEEGECKPISQYGKSKLKAERFCPEGSFITRLFNVYGTRGNSVINSFCKQIPKYEDIVVFGNGLQTRDYVHVSDVVNALILGLENSGTYNVGTGTETTVLDVIEMIRAVARSKPRPSFTLPLENEIKRSRANIEKIKQLKWEPRIQLIDGIKIILDSEKQ